MQAVATDSAEGTEASANQLATEGGGHVIRATVVLGKKLKRGSRRILRLACISSLEPT